MGALILKPWIEHYQLGEGEHQLRCQKHDVLEKWNSLNYSSNSHQFDKLHFANQTISIFFDIFVLISKSFSSMIQVLKMIPFLRDRDDLNTSLSFFTWPHADEAVRHNAASARVPSCQELGISSNLKSKQYELKFVWVDLFLKICIHTIHINFYTSISPSNYSNTISLQPTSKIWLLNKSGRGRLWKKILHPNSLRIPRFNLSKVKFRDGDAPWLPWISWWNGTIIHHGFHHNEPPFRGDGTHALLVTCIICFTCIIVLMVQKHRNDTGGSKQERRGKNSSQIIRRDTQKIIHFHFVDKQLAFV